MNITKKHSLRRIILRSQLITLCFVIAAVSVSNLILYRNLFEHAANQRDVIIRTELRNTENEMERIRWQLDKLTSEAADPAIQQIGSTYPYFAVQSLHQYLLTSDQNAQYFVLLPNGILLKNTQNSRNHVFISSMERFLFFDLLRSNPDRYSAPIAQAAWRFIALNGKTWLVLVYQYNGVYTGAVLRAEVIFANLIRELTELGGSCTITDEAGETYHSGFASGTGNLPLSVMTFAGTLSLDGSTQVKLLAGFINGVVPITLILSIITVIVILFTDHRVNRLVVEPLNQLAVSIDDLQKDPQHMRLEENAPVYELAKVEHTLNYLLEDVVSTRLQLMDRQMKEQKDQLRSLRAQLRSHFYLNAIMTVSNMTYQNRNEDIREYLDLLSRHMRYMMRIHTDTVELGEELEHVDHYVSMQNIRFPDSVVLVEDCPEDCLHIRIPHLYLYTIVENAFKHAMSLENTLLLMITCRKTNTTEWHGCSIVIEDNGQGFTEEFLRDFNNDQDGSENETGHIGLRNIRQSLWLRYHRRDLIVLSNAIPQGAKVELKIPDTIL